MKVGEKIKKIRELKNYTQQYMASSLELSISGYGKIERDETDLSLSKLEKIATVLGVVKTPKQTVHENNSNRINI